MIIGMTFVSCKSEEEDSTALMGLLAMAATTPVPVSVNFAVVSGTTSVDCSTDLGTSIAGAATSFVVNDMRFYVSGVKLLTASGSENITMTDSDWQNQNVALVDMEDATGNCIGTAATNSSVSGTVAPGTYTGIEFTVGVPFELNHLDVTTAVAPFNASGMFWTWLTGYRFMRFDYTADGTNGFYHLGSMGCVNDPLNLQAAPDSECMWQNRATIRLTKTDFALSGETINLDLSKLMANVSTGAVSCHSKHDGTQDAACTALMSPLGVDFSTGDSTPANQTVFSFQ